MYHRRTHFINFEPNVDESGVLDAAIRLTEEKERYDFFLKAAAFLYKHTQADYVGIGFLEKNKQHVRTCILLHKDVVLKNITYTLKGTPCEQVFIQEFCYYPFGVKNQFPEDKLLQRLNIESYLGTLLLSPESEAIGVVELFSGKTIENPAFAELLILILGHAIEEELLSRQPKKR